MVGHEQTDADAGTIFKWMIGLLVLMVVSIVAMRLMFVFLVDMPAESEPTPMEAQRVVPPSPRLQIDEPADLSRAQADEKGALNSYGWVNKEAGVVRIPIDRAMDLVVERGAGKKQ